MTKVSVFLTLFTYAYGICLSKCTRKSDWLEADGYSAAHFALFGDYRWLVLLDFCLITCITYIVTICLEVS